MTGFGERPGGRSLIRTVKRRVAMGIAIILAGLCAVVGVLVMWSYPGRPAPYLDEAGNPLSGSISEKIRLDINGVSQGMFIKSTDMTHPVLLYLHGGLPDYFLDHLYPSGLDEQFTVVWWEQRGAGLSYSPDLPPATLTVEQFIADTVAVTNYLRDRFGKEKIYLMGHSGGSFFGIQAAARMPQLYEAYIGVAQMADQLESERLAYDYMLKRFRAEGNTPMVRKLEAAPVTSSGGTPPGYLKVRDTAMHTLGIGTMHHMSSVVSGIFLPSLQSREYTLGEKVKLWRGKFGAGVSSLWSEMITTDLGTTVTELSIPVYFFHGIYDYTCSYAEARAYFDLIKAPVKGFYTFDQSAHGPIFEEPDKVGRILSTDVLAGAHSLADSP
jgi:pimeloyl-ACP methyl ester carboxylesterase